MLIVTRIVTVRDDMRMITVITAMGVVAMMMMMVVVMGRKEMVGIDGVGAIVCMALGHPALKDLHVEGPGLLVTPL